MLYATCYGDYNDTSIGMAALAVLAKNGVETKVVHPHCCGMPKLEQGLIGEVADAARKSSPPPSRHISTRATTLSRSVPSCALMLKFEWPLILPR